MDKLGSSDRLITLVQELGDWSPRHVGGVGGSYIEEGEWAAKTISREFGVDAFDVLSQRAKLSLMLQPENMIVVRQLGLQSTDIAEKWKETSMKHLMIALNGICSIDKLKDYFVSNDPDRRASTAAALGVTRSHAGVSELIHLLDDEVEEVRDVALVALQRITGKSFLFGKNKSSKWRKWWSKQHN